jgi:tetratricopeptide (TPR) repeat protein
MSYSETQELQEATPFQIIEIMIEEGAYTQAEEMFQLLSSSEQDSFKYYYLMGKLEKEKGNNQEALNFYMQASEKEPANIAVRVAILKLKIQNNEKPSEIRKEIKSILVLDLKTEDREAIEEIAKVYEESIQQKNYLLSFSTGLGTTDNVYETKDDKKSDVYADTRLTVAHKMSLANEINLTSFASYGNKLYFSESEKTSHNIYIGTEPEKEISDWVLSTPLTYNTNSEDGETVSSGFSLGLKGKRKIYEDMLLTTGLDLISTQNDLSDYEGTSVFLFANVNLNVMQGINITPELSLETTNYDEDSENYTAFAAKIGGKKLIREKYMVNASYKITSKSYDDRSDLNHNLNANMEAGLLATKWKYIVGYNIRMNDSDSSSNEYTVNNLSLKVKKEFN